MRGILVGSRLRFTIPWGMLNDYQQARVSELVRVAAAVWSRADCAVEHIADSGNSVWLVSGRSDRWILRLTNPEYRSFEENEAELEFIRYLDTCGVPVATPVESDRGTFVEQVCHDGATVCASVFTFAEGEYVTRDSELWGEAMIRAWGQSLGAMHRAARGFRPISPARRWEWADEIFLTQAPRLIPVAEPDVRREFEDVMRRVQSLPRTPESFGMIHADYAPQNFRYHPVRGITMFDFGNCCYHWYASDVAVSLSVLRRLPPAEREQARSWLLESYLEMRPSAQSELAMIPLFIRLRVLYVYLSRLFKFGPAPTPDEALVLDRLRRSVLEPHEWEMN